MAKYGCQWNKPLSSKKLQKVDFVSKQAVKGLKLKKMTHKQSGGSAILEGLVTQPLKK